MLNCSWIYLEVLLVKEWDFELLLFGLVSFLFIFLLFVCGICVCCLGFLRGVIGVLRVGLKGGCFIGGGMSLICDLLGVRIVVGVICGGNCVFCVGSCVFCDNEVVVGGGGVLGLKMLVVLFGVCWCIGNGVICNDGGNFMGVGCMNWDLIMGVIFCGMFGMVLELNWGFEVKVVLVGGKWVGVCDVNKVLLD